MVVALSLAVVGFAAVGARPALAQTMVSLPDTVVPSVTGADRTGALDPTTPMDVAIDMALRDPGGLAAVDSAVSTPGSPDYGHYLTAAQFAERFGPNSTAIDTVRTFATAAGLTVTGVSGNNQVVDVHGSAGQFAAAFHTTIGTYVRDGNTFYANDSTLVLPAAIAAVVSGVVGLDDTIVATPAGTVATGPTGGYSPAQIDSAYRFAQVGATGAGQTVALWEFDGYKSADLSTYQTQYSVAGPAVATVPVDNANYDAAPGSGEFEVEMDSEIVSAIAPSATQLIYEAPNTGPGAIDMANKIISDGKASVMSISWGECEAVPSASFLTASNNAYSQAVAQGISIYSASGDRGSRDCSTTPSTKAVDFPGSSPYDTSVGGTTLTLASGAYGSEAAWGSSGGGASTAFTRPSWQPGSQTMRLVPDVSSDAAPASSFSAYINSAWVQAGGTSAAAPTWAAMSVLYNQKAKAAGKANLGFVNPALYQLAAGSRYGSVLHDVTTGANNDYSAGTGFDEVTGLGTPIADGLVAALLGNAVTITNPGAQSTRTGAAVSLSVRATDSGSATLTYAASGLPTGLTINSTTGLISGTPTGAGTFPVTLTVTDSGGASSTASFTWTVTSGANTVSAANPGNQSTVVGSTVSLAIQATDSGSSTLTYAATGLPAGLSINASTGVITGAPTAAGTSSVSVTITDATKASTTISFTWTVTAASYSVSMTNPGVQLTAIGTAVSLQIHATDSGGSTLTYTATGLPAGLAINASTGLVTGKPTTSGNTTVKVTATDAVGASAWVSFTWTIR